MRLGQKFVPVVVFAVLLGGIGLAQWTGVWATTSQKNPARYTSGAYAGQYNPADIRGSYTLADVARLFAIDEPVLLSAFALPADTDASQYRTRDLEARYAGLEREIGNESVQVFVALYKQLPVTLEDTALPDQAVDLILGANPDLTQEQRDWLDAHRVDVSSVSPPVETVSPHPVTALQINGKTTFQNLLDAGLSREQVESVLGQAMPATNQTVKDFCLAENLPFSSVKNEIAALLAP
ncbi:MAG: hypothetical protein GX112_02825 [Clostridiaceae bacterium]|jgi:hypothetical protein|nr:hypothetical protein [Clostridiaceae bacterium]